MAKSGNPLISALNGVASIKEIHLESPMSPHTYTGFIAEDKLFIVCSYNKKENAKIVADASKENYMVHDDKNSIDECVGCGQSEVSGIKIISSSLDEGTEDDTPNFCESCFSELIEDIEVLIEENSENIASNVI